MKKTKSLLSFIAFIILSFTLGFTLRPIIAFGSENGFSILLQVYDLLISEYVKKDLNKGKLVQGAIEGMLNTLDDPYTRYMDKEAFKEMKEEREGNFSGIGIQIGIRNKHLTVIAPIEDTPAYKAGLLAGDYILEIDGKPSKDITLDQAVNLIRGKKGVPVKLKIYRKSEEKTFEVSIVRDIIKTKVVKFRMIDKNIGYIKLTSFMENNAPNEVKEAVEKLRKEGMKSLILDLRNNPGGLLENAVEIGKMFVPTGPVVQIVDRENNKEYKPKINDKRKTILPLDISMVTLINEGSASASEILAGCLKDNKRSILIGTKTFGKGLVQTVHPLSDGSGVAITTNKYLTSKGNDIDKKGIEPDIIVESIIPKVKPGEDEPLTIKDQDDNQLQKAINFLKEKTAKNNK